MSENLVEVISRHMDANGGDGLFITPIDGLFLMRRALPAIPAHLIYRPALCLVVQGGKSISIGKKVLDYTAMQALIVSVELPAFGRVTQASAQQPFLGVTVEFDIGVMREVMQELDAPPKPNGTAGLGVFVSDCDGPLADCVLRLIRLLDTPNAIAVLQRAIMREICFWLLTGPHAGEVCKIALPNSHTQRVANAIYVLRDHYARTVRIEELAEAAQMSPSSFHQHFKALTSMTPLQYQKQLRLVEARRLMADDAANVETAAYQVGYESASQFSREYSRMFGTPPKRDVAALKAIGS
ncbi:AraC family transcriptional regulator [Burkholderia sp. L27(2015)]|uniref:AraC family transcriptional regulator n=1 Tax=Burkholderia sp. L27(2015) TaxID=1641858 RepID=UPI00131ADED4|nr:AraC family transcriptional regulator [Burkholderia sp. L27(2015)]